MMRCDTNEYASCMAQWFYGPVESALGLVLKQFSILLMNQLRLSSVTFVDRVWVFLQGSP